jgi:hypothetical protein
VDHSAAPHEVRPELRVPLSPRAIEILMVRRAGGCGELVFANVKGKAYSDMALTALLRRLGFTFTAHGFRSTFRDWCAEQTGFPREVCEAALAHSNKDTTKAAYFRSDLFEKRRQLMTQWADYCGVPHTNARWSGCPLLSAHRHTRIAQPRRREECLLAQHQPDSRVRSSWLAQFNPS